MNARPLSIRSDVSTAVLKELFVPNFLFTVESSINTIAKTEVIRRNLKPLRHTNGYCRCRSDVFSKGN